MSGPPRPGFAPSQYPPPGAQGGVEYMGQGPRPEVWGMPGAPGGAQIGGLPPGAPEFVPAAVAAAQRAAGMGPGGAAWAGGAQESPMMRPPGGPNVNAAPFVPGGGGGGGIGGNVNAAPFVPRGGPQQQVGRLPPQQVGRPDAQPFVPTGRQGMASAARQGGGQPGQPMPFGLPDDGDLMMSMSAPSPAAAAGPPGHLHPQPMGPGRGGMGPGGGNQLTDSMAAMSMGGRLMPGDASLAQQQQAAAIAAASHGGAMYFYSPGQGGGMSGGGMPGMGQQMQQMYGGGPGGGGAIGGGPMGQGRPPHGGGGGPQTRMQLGSRFLEEGLRQELQQRAYLVQAQVDPETEAAAGLPATVHQYHSLFPLEAMPDGVDDPPSAALGVRSLVVKGISSADGQPYALRRIDGRQVVPTAQLQSAANEAVERWGKLAGHPNIAALRTTFVSKDMEDGAALFFVHDFYPGAATLAAVHLQQQEQNQGVVHLSVTEDQLWSYATQLAGALRAIHSVGLACRPGALAPSKVILTGRGRVRLAAVGVQEALGGEAAAAEDVRALQREDLAALGGLLLALACGAFGQSLEFLAAHFSSGLSRLVAALVGAGGEGGAVRDVHQLCGLLGERVFAELEHASMLQDVLQGELGKELENGRLMRLLAKVNFVADRPDADMHQGWAETGDRYLVKLFRDFVFHQCGEDGRPALDWGHVVECLNKLDAGVPERVLLLSRDESSMLVVSYRDVKRCIEGAFAELEGAAS